MKRHIWQKKWVLPLTLGIVALAGYGIWNTAAAYAKNLDDLNTANAALTSGATTISNGLNAGNGGCSPGGCAVCGGCINGLYQQSVEELPSQTSLDQVY
jgi:hypothetical protein